jgi:hypothetical protein
MIHLDIFIKFCFLKINVDGILNDLIEQLFEE